MSEQPTVAEGQRITWDRANVITQVRNQNLTEGFKGLILINAGGAAALGAFIQAVWDKKSAEPMLSSVLHGISWLLVGTAVAAIGFVARHLSFFHPNTAKPFRNPWWWAELVTSLLAVSLFVVGMGVAVAGALRAVVARAAVDAASSGRGEPMLHSYLTFPVGEQSEWFWVMCQSIILVISLILIVRQVRHMRQANMLQALLALDERWKSKEFYAYRVSACKRYGDGRLDIGRREGELLSFFEGLGAYLKRNVFDREILWEKYSYYVEPYWLMFQPHIDKFRSSSQDNSWYDNFEYLNEQMSKCAADRGLKNYGTKTPDDMKRFVAAEAEMSSDRGHRWVDDERNGG